MVLLHRGMVCGTRVFYLSVLAWDVVKTTSLDQYTYSLHLSIFGLDESMTGHLRRLVYIITWKLVMVRFDVFRGILVPPKV